MVREAWPLPIRRPVPNEGEAAAPGRRRHHAVASLCAVSFDMSNSLLLEVLLLSDWWLAELLPERPLLLLESYPVVKAAVLFITIICKLILLFNAFHNVL